MMQKRECGKPPASLEQFTEAAYEAPGNTASIRSLKPPPCGIQGEHASSTNASVELTASPRSISVEQAHVIAGEGQPTCVSQAQTLPLEILSGRAAPSASEGTDVETSSANATASGQKPSEPNVSPNPVVGDQFDEQWPLGSISASVFGSSEPLGFITLVSTFGSWISAAFDKRGEEGEEDEGEDDDGQEEEEKEKEEGEKEQEEKEREKGKGEIAKGEAKPEADEPKNVAGGAEGSAKEDGGGEVKEGTKGRGKGEKEVDSIQHQSFPKTTPPGSSHAHVNRKQATQAEASRVLPSSEIHQDVLGQGESLPSSHSFEDPSCMRNGDDFHIDPQVLLHLCGQPKPVRWTPDGFVPTENKGVRGPYDTGNDVSQHTDPYHLQVPAPQFSTECGSLLTPSGGQASLRQVAESIEMWLLDIGSQSLGVKGEESASSSDSLGEITGAPLTDFGGGSAFAVGPRGTPQTRSDDGRGGLNGDSSRLKLGVDSRGPLDGTLPSSASPVVEGNGETVREDKHLHSLLPRYGAKDNSATMKGASRARLLQLHTKGRSSRQIMTRIGMGGRSKLHLQRMYRPSRPPNKGKSPEAGTVNSTAFQDDFVLLLNGSEFSDYIESTQNLDAKADAEETFANVQLLAPVAGENSNPNRAVLGDEPSCEALVLFTDGELSTEEAAAKEASARSWGNRIWAFFGGETGTDRTNAGGDSKMDVVEQTLPFEDPAVVQRDDHRAFSSETSLLLESIKKEPTLQFLNPQQQRYVASLMRRDVFAPSTCIAEEGADASLMWCSSGEFEVSQAGFFGVSVLRSLTPGEFFGLEELVSGEKLKCSLTSRQSTSECALWVLDTDIFNDSVREMLAHRKAFVPVAQSFLHMVRLVRDLPEEEIAAVAKACKVERFAEGQTVFKMGFHGDMFCFIYKGEAITQKPQDDGGFLELARQGKGEYFGEMALIRNTRRTASVVAGTELVLFCLDKESFETLLCPLREKMPMRAAQAAKAASTYKRQDDAPPTENEAKSADGTALASVVGTGGAAEACAKKRTRKNSLALLNYSKIRDQERQAENGESDAPEDRSTARWRLAREPESIHEPPPLSARGGRSCLKESNAQGGSRKRKSPVRFDEGSLLPSESSSDEG